MVSFKVLCCGNHNMDIKGLYTINLYTIFSHAYFLVCIFEQYWCGWFKPLTYLLKYTGPCIRHQMSKMSGHFSNWSMVAISTIQQNSILWRCHKNMWPNYAIYTSYISIFNCVMHFLFRCQFSDKLCYLYWLPWQPIAIGTVWYIMILLAYVDMIWLLPSLQLK